MLKVILMGADSIDYIMRIEDAFGLRIPDKDACELPTVGQMHEYLVGRLPSLSADCIWERQLDLLCDLLRLPPSKRKEISPTDHFVRDLGFS